MVIPYIEINDNLRKVKFTKFDILSFDFTPKQFRLWWPFVPYSLSLPL